MAIKINTKISQFNFYTERDQGSAAVNDSLFIDVKSSLGLSRISSKISDLSVTTWVGVQ